MKKLIFLIPALFIAGTISAQQAAGDKPKVLNGPIAPAPTKVAPTPAAAERPAPAKKILSPTNMQVSTTTEPAVRKKNANTILPSK
jgi:hypothetical protein